MKNDNIPTIRARPRIPPTTPPAIAPAFDFLFDSIEVGEDVEVEVGIDVDVDVSEDEVVVVVVVVAVWANAVAKASFMNPASGAVTVARPLGPPPISLTISGFTWYCAGVTSY